jgi:hypothetical protein
MGCRIIHSDNETAREHARDDILSFVEKNPDQIPGLLSALIEGRVNGRDYFGECSCLLGTIASLKLGHTATKLDIPDQFKDSEGFKSGFLELVGRTPRESSYAESWFYEITPGDTPKNNPYSCLAVKWIATYAEEKGIL